MKIAVLGLGGSSPPPGYGGPGFLVKDHNRIIAVDCGKSCLEGLRYLNISPCDISMVYLSHIHIDHTYGLFELSVERIAKNCPNLKIAMHPEVYGSYNEIEKMLPSSINIEPVIDLPIHIGEYRILPWKAKHTSPTYGILLEDSEGNTILYYTSDTGYTDEILETAKKSKISLIEATLPSNMPPLDYHLATTDFIRIAKTTDQILIPVHLTKESLDELLGMLFSFEGQLKARIIIGRPPIVLTI